MENKKKLMIVVIAVAVILTLGVVGLTVAIVASNQSANAGVRMKFVAVDVYVQIEATLYANDEEYIFVNGDDTKLVLSPEVQSGVLTQPNSNEILEVSDGRVVFEYKFTNLGDGVNANISLVGMPTAVYNYNIGYAASHTPITDFAAMSLEESLSNAYLGSTDTDKILYVYIVADVDNVLTDANIQGIFDWNLNRVTAE